MMSWFVSVIDSPALICLTWALLIGPLLCFKVFRCISASTYLTLHRRFLSLKAMNIFIGHTWVQNLCFLCSRGGTITWHRVCLSVCVSLSDGQYLSLCQADCASLYHSGVRRSGVYNVVLSPGAALPVYCDMETEGETHSILHAAHIHTCYIV